LLWVLRFKRHLLPGEGVVKLEVGHGVRVIGSASTLRDAILILAKIRGKVGSFFNCFRMSLKNPSKFNPLSPPGSIEDIVAHLSREERMKELQTPPTPPYEEEGQLRTRLRVAECGGIRLDFLVDNYVDEIPQSLERAKLSDSICRAIWQYLAEVALEKGNLKRCAQCMYFGKVLVSFHALQRMRRLMPAEVVALMNLANSMGAVDYAEQLRLWLETGDPNAPFRKAYSSKDQVRETRRQVDEITEPAVPRITTGYERNRDGSSSPAYREKHSKNNYRE
jgi:hypothetical protein